MKKEKTIDILLPCYNEGKTLKECIKRIRKIMDKEKYLYNIILCDNYSSDNSRDIAKKEKCDVLIEKEKGYGATLLNGINNSKVDYIVMLDSDLSYNEKHIPELIKCLDEGYDLAIGNRFKGNIEKGAMPFSHRHGSRFLTGYANLLFRTPCHDFHCGLRAFKRKSILKCNLNSKGFEFASEMVIKAKINKLKIKEIPTDLFVDGREGKSHLRTIRDGLRHFGLITKLKFNQSSVFKYIFTFILLIMIFFTSLILVSLIPQKIIYNNTLKSLEFFEKYRMEMNGHNLNFAFIEGCGDVRDISMAYNMNPENLMDSAIRMPYQVELDTLYEMGETFKQDKGEKVNYSRYWQGQAMYSKIMLVFMPVGYVLYGLQLVSIIVLLIMILRKLWKKNRILAISFFIMDIGINAFFTAFSVQYFFATLLMHIFSLIIINLYEKKSKYIGLMFAINGGITCFFDFLTSETIVLTIPLFIYIALTINEGNKIRIKEIIKYIMLWGIFYSFTFFTKWLIDMFYFGPDYIKVIIQKMMIRVDDNTLPLYSKLLKSILISFGDILPLGLYKKGAIIFTILLLFSLYILGFYNKEYRGILVLILIPFMRFALISTHSLTFHYFAYRALGIVVIFITYMFLKLLKKLNLKH